MQFASCGVAAVFYLIMLYHLIVGTSLPKLKPFFQLLYTTTVGLSLGACIVGGLLLCYSTSVEAALAAVFVIAYHVSIGAYAAVKLRCEVDR